MTCVLIIEDRPLRMKGMLSEEDVAKLTSLSNVTLSESLPDDYSDYDILAIHKSYMDRNALYSKLIALLSDKQKRLIVFSGGNYRQIIQQGGQFLILSAKEFYSSNLIPFLEELSSDTTSDVILEKLLYGIDNWELPVWAKIRNLEWLNSDNNDFEIEDQIDELRNSIGVDKDVNVCELINSRLGI